jgi:hypothetical protein
MALREPKYEDFNSALRREQSNMPDSVKESVASPEPGEPNEETGVSPQYRVIETEQPTVKADVEERQAVEVRPMRYVLGIGIALAIVAMFVAWFMMR